MAETGLVVFEGSAAAGRVAFEGSAAAGLVVFEGSAAAPLELPSRQQSAERFCLWLTAES